MRFHQDFTSNCSTHIMPPLLTLELFLDELLLLGGTCSPAKAVSGPGAQGEVWASHVRG